MTAPLAVEVPAVWAQLAEPLPLAAIKWRQDGKPTARDGKFLARFVPYIDATTVAERLDAHTPGWRFSAEPLPARDGKDGLPDPLAYVKGTLTIFPGDGHQGSVSRDGIGSGKDAKAAATDALKRAAVLFGIGRELYGMTSIWVQVDGDSKNAKPVQNPSEVYAAKTGFATPPEPAAGKPYVSKGEDPLGTFPDRPASDKPPCPKCGGQMWDNRVGKRNPRAPDFKCRDRSCDGVIWPPKDAKPALPPPEPEQDEDDDELPF